MATNSADVVNTVEPVQWSFARFADRWIFVFTAALFVATALAGFVPESIGIVAASESRPATTATPDRALARGY